MKETFKGGESLETPEQLISGAESLEELFEVLRGLGTIQGSEKEYSAEFIIGKVEEGLESIKRNKIRTREEQILSAFFTDVTRSHGLRTKVVELVKKNQR